MKHLFKTIIRNFIRKPFTNLLNLTGLAISFTVVIILSVYCYSELSTDAFQKNGARVYLYGMEDHLYTPGVLKDNIDLKVPGVEYTVRVGGSWEAPVFQTEGKDPIVSDLIFTDEDFFKVFTYRVIEGNPDNALKEPMTIVITKTLSDKLFGTGNALGKTIKLNNKHSLTVGSVIEEPESNSCISFNALTSMATRKIIQPETGEFSQWNQCNFQTFVLLKDGIDPLVTSKTLLSLFPDNSKESFKDQDLVQLKKIYFSNFTLYGTQYLITGDRKKVMILVLVALLVLTIALINFINISSSQWQEKIKQTGVMKIIGAKRGTILRGILAESFLFFLFALLISIYLVNTFSSVIYDYLGIHFSHSLTLSTGFLLCSLGIILIISTVLTIIPASRISSSLPVDDLKKPVISNGISSRGLLVTIQFTIAMGLIAFTLLVQKQIKFGTSSLGIRQENIIGVKLTEQLNQKRDVLKSILLENPGITNTSFSQYYPGKTISEWGTILNLSGEKKEVSFNTFAADSRLFEILGLKLIMGRYFNDDNISDKGKLVVNETFLRKYNITNPIGGRLDIERKGYNPEIIGVVRDFNYQPVNTPIAPLAIRNEPYYTSYCLVSLHGADFNSLHSNMGKIKEAVSELSPSFPVEVSFFDEALENMYQSELHFRRTFSLLALCAIVISSMGILAMSIFSCQLRVKEIGIRKVNGAKVTEVLAMLNREFVKWVFVSFLISTPVAWYAIHKWLELFTYKTKVSWWIFALSGVIALAIALITVSWQSWRAATRNPVEALRYE